MSQEIDQKLKLSTSNIIALVAVLLTIIGGYINVIDTQSKQSQKIDNLEKADEEKKAGFAKVDFKLDKISESLNQLKVDLAGERAMNAERGK